MKSTCWDPRATNSKIKSGQKDTEASIPSFVLFMLDIQGRLSLTNTQKV